MAMRVEFEPSRELYPFRSRWFETRGIRMHYVDEGSGDPLLMCHGNPTWSFLFRGMITRLRERFRCVAVDYPGFGLSDRPSGYGYTPAEHAALVAKLAFEELKLDRLVVVGQDWGGPIGMAIAVGAPERIRGLVFGNTWFWPAEGSLRSFSIVMSSPPMQWLIRERNFFVEFIIPRAAARPLPPPVMDQYRRAQPNAAARVGVAEFPRQIRKARTFLAGLEERAPQRLADRPMLLPWGLRDPAFGQRTVIDRWRRAFPSAEVMELAGASHYLWEDEPAAISEAITRKFG
jgi:haloalkane dehalogenase